MSFNVTNTTSTCTASTFNSSIYIACLDRSKFLTAFLEYGQTTHMDHGTRIGRLNCEINIVAFILNLFSIAFFYPYLGIPCIICGLLGGWAFWKAQFKIRLLPSVVSMVTFRDWLADDKRLEKSLAWICTFIIGVATLPSVFILLWGIYVYKNINHLLGFAIFLVLMSLQLTGYAFSHWRVNGWRLDRLVKFLFATSLTAMWAFEIWTVYDQKPFTYFMLSVVYIGYNMIPMTILTYLVAQTMTKPVEGYQLLDVDPVADYHTYLREIMTQQAVKAEVNDSVPLGPFNDKRGGSAGVVKFHVPKEEGAGVQGETNEEKSGGRIDVKPIGGDVAIAIPTVGIQDIPDKYRTPVWKIFVCYFLAILMLLAYSISVQLRGSDGSIQTSGSNGFSNRVGWITSGTIIILDITVWLCVYGGKITSPLTACLYQGACRIILISFGDIYWFIGHSMMYVVLAVFFGHTIVNSTLPKLNGTRQTTTAVATLLDSSGTPTSPTAGAVVPATGEAKLDAVLEVEATRNSDQIGAGFMSHGRFAQTRFGKHLLSHIEYYAFTILTAAFLIDIIVCSDFNPEDIHLQRDQQQYVAGILAIFLTAIVLSSQTLYRMYYNRDFRVDWKLVLSCCLQWAISCGCGGFLFHFTWSIILICFFCYLPPVVYLSTYAYTEWWKNDFQLYIDPTNAPKAAGAGGKKREDTKNTNTSTIAVVPGSPDAVSIAIEEQKTPEGQVFIPVDARQQPTLGSSPKSASVPKMNIKEINVDLGKYNTLKKYQIIFCSIVAAILVIGMGSTISVHSNPPYVGYTIMAVILILASTAIPIIEWFNSFEISKNMIVQLVVTTVFFLAFILIFWIQALNKENNNQSLALLFTLFIYPTLVVLTFAIIKYRDDKWVMSPFVRNSLIVCCAFITTFLIIVAVVYNPWEIGATLLVGFMVILFGSFIVPILVHRFPWLIKWTLILGLCILIALAAGIGSTPDNGFVGFSLAWGILFACLFVSAVQAHRNISKVNIISHLYSPNIFPVFMYDLTPGLKNPLKSDDRRVYLVFVTLFVSMVWGVLAVFFLETTWIGLGVHAISIVLLVIYIWECQTLPRILLAKAVRYLGEGSDLYISTVHQAKLAAFRSQLTSIKSTSTSRDQQLMSPSATSPSSVGSAKSPASGKGADASSSSSSSSNAGKSQEKPLSLAEEAARNAEPDLLLLDEADLQLLGLDEPGKPLNELDWQGLYGVFTELRKATPLPSLTAVFQCDKVEVAQVTWRGKTMPRRRAHELLLKLSHHIAELHINFLSYQTQLQCELILSVEGMKHEEDQEILTMLRDTGHSDLTIDYIRNLKPNSTEKIQLEAALKDWKKAQEFLLAERKRKRKEEEIQTKIREEEERQRVLAEEARLRKQKEDQARLDEEAARRKQEELAQHSVEEKRRQEEERRQREEDEARRVQAAALEQARREREAAEAERKKREDEIAAKLIAEQNERQLQILRQQQEAARLEEVKRKELERKKLEQLAAEQAARDKALADKLAAEKLLQAKIDAAYAKHQCTLNETGEQFVKQQWYQCLTCGSPNGEGCCEWCSKICHAGHQLKNMGVTPFYCDCGKTGCEAATGVKPGLKGKPTLESIQSKFAKDGQPWVDPDFPPDATSLLRDPANSQRKEWKELQWKRPEQLRNVKTPVLFENGADPLDINQGQIGDCWFMSAISVLTQRQKDLMNVFVSKDHTKAGVYSVNFWKNGERINILIDSHFPATKQGQPAFGHSVSDSELWVMILEKAYAKLHRTYEAIESGFVDQALIDLSGAIGSRIDMSKDPGKKEARTGQLFQQLLSYRQQGFLLGAGSPAGSDSEANASPSGIVQGHAYAILDVQEVDENQLLRLRNPWGRKEWTGDWSDHSDKWTRRMKAKLNWVDADDGAFWMSMLDFSRHFDEIYVARFFDADKGWIQHEPIRGEWKGPTAGGCTNYDTVKDNPQYLLTITQPTTVVMNLSQTDTRGTSEKLKPIAIEVYNNKGQRITRTRTGPLICSNPDSYIFRREINLEQQFEPQKEPYTILLSTFNQNEETKFTLQIFSTQPIQVDVAPPVVPKVKKAAP